MLDIQFYGVLQQVAGTRSLQVDLKDDDITVDQVLTRLRQDVPALSAHLPRVACAQGESLVRRSDAVDPRQPLVLLPPVSGGGGPGQGRSA
ncbi:MoaD/ThiS family protein [Aquisalimonas asiatica]|uniref:Molybdopterin synthase sulfur carrier subunit n=1 Tax=Aquisalimonas asiatica TaxID=406100 RepID=A0A1H8R2E1_9GAMM|nr:MoaD/ThiS family protein [Aquisalimonas asiatica]SEO60328.1 molybdopterin synthase sulfur carrier subunit [Aquisalimonas asiatica]